MLYNVRSLSKNQNPTILLFNHRNLGEERHQIPVALAAARAQTIANFGFEVPAPATHTFHYLPTGTSCFALYFHWKLPEFRLSWLQENRQWRFTLYTNGAEELYN